jgi:outer membrane protein TolC
MAVEQRELQLVAARNQLQPKLDTAVAYRWYGFGDTSSKSDSADDLLRKWNAGINFQLPIGHRRELASVRNAELQLERAKAALKDMELNVMHLLTTAAREVDSHFQLTKTHFNRWQAGQKEVRSVAELYKSGKTTLDLVLDAQRRRAQSRSDYTAAIQAYATAIMSLHFRTGSLLAEHNIAVESPQEAEATEEGESAQAS